MSSFKEFDLELRKVAEDIPQDKAMPLSVELTWMSCITHNTNCNSVDVPTGGTTRMCCKNNNVEAKCI